MLIKRRLYRNFDFFLLFLTVALSGYGLVIIHSATSILENPDPLFFVKRQAIWLGVGLAAIAVLSFFDYLNFYYWARYLYGACLVLLLLVLFIGRGTREAPDVKRWIDLGAFDIQPSEYVKLALIIILAKFLADADRDRKLHALPDLFPALALTFGPMVLIFLQPDLGTSMVFVAILLGSLYIAGTNRKHIFALMGAGIALLPVFWMFLKDYQRMRLIIFLDPQMEPLGQGYQLTQSMIAVGSGGITGKSLYGGSQSYLRFLPEHHTDFIFSVLGEELGFIGSMVLLLLFFLMIYRILWIGFQAKDMFGVVICSGTAIMIAFQVLVNVGMTIGIMPVTGLPLPFMSYGGNALLVNCLAIGLVINVGMRRQKIQF